MNNLQKFIIGVAVGAVIYLISTLFFSIKGYWIAFAVIMLLSVFSSKIFPQKECEPEQQIDKK